MKYPLSILSHVLFVAQLAAAQRTTFPNTLSNYPTTPEGSFIRPTLDQGQVFQNGSKLIVTWSSVYVKANLFLIADDVFWYPNWLLANTTQTSYEWSVNDHGNNTSFFRFRLINALGTEEEQATGGIESGAFWVADQALVDSFKKPTTTAPPVALPVATTAPTTPASLNGVSTSANLGSLTNTATTATTGTIPSTATSKNSTGILSMPVAATVTVSIAPSTTAAASSSNDAAPTTSMAMVAGISIGAGVLLIALTAGLVFFLFRRRRKDTSAVGSSKEITEEPPQYAHNPSYSSLDLPKEAPGDACVMEMPGHSHSIKEAPAGVYYAEAPGHFGQPHELPASYGRKSMSVRELAAHHGDWRSKPLPAPFDNGR